MLILCLFFADLCPKSYLRTNGKPKTKVQNLSKRNNKKKSQKVVFVKVQLLANLPLFFVCLWL